MSLLGMNAMYGITRYPHEHVSPCQTKRPSFALHFGQRIWPDSPSKFIHFSLSLIKI